MNITRTLLLLCFPLAIILAASVPNESTWQPIERMLASDKAEAVPQAEQLCKQYPRWPQAHIALANYYYRKGLLAQDNTESWYAKGILAASSARKINSAKARPYELIVLGFLLEGKRLEKGISFYERYKTQDKNGRLHMLGARCAMAAGRHDEAKEFLARAVKAAGNKITSSMLNLQAVLACQNGDWKTAAAKLERALGKVDERTAYPEVLSELHYNRGIALWNLDELPEARLHFSTAIKKNPRNGNARFGFGIVALQMNDSSAAIPALSEAQRLLPDNAEVAAALGAAHILETEVKPELHHFEDARTALEQAQELGHRSAATTSNLLSAYVGTQATDRIGPIFESLGSTVITDSARAISRWHLAQLRADADPEQALLDCNEAITSLTRARETGNIEINNATYFLGHMWSTKADILLQSFPENKEALAVAQDNARDNYKTIADQGDLVARQHFLARESQRDAQHAYAAGWHAVSWNTFSKQAWSLILGNYGASGAWSQPLSLIVWGALILSSLFFALKKGPARPTNPATSNPLGSPLKDETLMPKTIAPRTNPLEKGPGSGGYKSKSETTANNRPADETLMPQPAEQQTHKDAALDSKKSKR